MAFIEFKVDIFNMSNEDILCNKKRVHCARQKIKLLALLLLARSKGSRLTTLGGE